MKICRVVRSVGFVALLSLVAAANVPVTPALAQDSNWWEGITGFGPQSFSNKSGASERTPPKPDAVNDLRPNDVPWRSDEMRDAMDKAIDVYQQIVSRGGWPVIPGNRMMRAGDDDERVPLLRRRLGSPESSPAARAMTIIPSTAPSKPPLSATRSDNGLRASGRVDQPTLAALNVSAEERLAQLKLNLGAHFGS